MNAVCAPLGGFAIVAAVRLPERIKKKLERLPDQPGVYVMRDRGGRVIYVGKAASLRHRVRGYFREATLRSADPKLRGLVHAVYDLDILPCRTEADAVLTEGRLIKEYKPRFNVDFRDDKRFLLLRVDPREPWPRFQAVRLDKHDGALYFGPYASSASARAAQEFVEKRFGLRSCAPRQPGPEAHRHCSNDVIRYCSAPCLGRITGEAYRHRVDEACAFLRGERPEILRELAEEMQREAQGLNFERAAALRDTLRLLREAVQRHLRRPRTLEIQAEEAREGLEELRKILGLAQLPVRIEAFDISTISGTHAVGSMVCCIGGRPQRSRYRRFRIRTAEGADDTRMMAEVVYRRYLRALREGQALPELVLVDGGLAQVRAAQAALERAGAPQVAVAGLAKRQEELIWERAPVAGSPRQPARARLPEDSKALRVLQQIRDEAHRFALAYHRILRARRIRESQLDEVPGVGPVRKRKLLEHFGSVARLARAAPEEIARVPGIGPALAQEIAAALARQDRSSKAG